MKQYKVGIFGVGRGMRLATDFMKLNCDIVAICDFHEERREKAAKSLNGTAAVYDNFDAFIEHDMDIVVLANYFHEHAPYAIECFKRGIHVYSECISNGTMAEGVELIRAYEKSNSIYMLAENYPMMQFNREMKRIVDTGTLGKILYAEGEYNHPGDPMDIAFKKEYNYYPEHWRNFLPRTYYITHSLGPVMRATGATPKRVTAFATFAPVTGAVPSASYGGDRAALVMTQNDDGSVFRITGCAAFGAHHNAYRICGTEGQIENLRGMDGKVMLRYNDWSKPEGANETTLYNPGWNDKDEAIIMSSGHGGGDYLTARLFIEALEAGKEPEHPYDIYSAINMSSVAILSHRSMLEGGMPYDIPDFHLEESRAAYENDRQTPFYGTDGSKPNIPCCSQTDYAPTEEQMKLFREMVMDE
ncbi:MAG: Gfo/Idh/MocA family oxidoreductase [Clostridia bacterium]|nr:Gfo/Idh/MocA family oxidoreductase [Clostridia bacterium]